MSGSILPVPHASRIPLRLHPAVALLAGAVLLVWPALLNGYPLLFSDTHAFLVQAGEPRMVWDKPFAYGPFLRLTHLGLTLWLPLAAQGLILSHLLWLVAKALGAARPLGHVALCGLLAIGSAAPWFTALLMPDIFAPVTVLGVFLLGFGVRLSRRERGWVGLLTAAAMAFHLTHLVVGAAAIAAGLALRPSRRTLRAGLPLAAALAFLAATNLVGFGRFAVSPYGSVFALARLVADGPAAEVIERACPQAGWHVCAFAGHLPTDSDLFLWDPKGPVWTAPGGPQGFAREAGAIVRQTLRDRPLAVLGAALHNGLRQLARVGLGDTLSNDWLESSVTGSLRAYFPPAELERFHAGLQSQGRLAAIGAALNPAFALILLAGALATARQFGQGLMRRGQRGSDPAWLALPALILVGVLANAAVCGALSGPHDRYQARIAWLVLLPPVLRRLRPRQGHVFPSRPPADGRFTPPAGAPRPPAPSAPDARNLRAGSR